MTSNLQKFCFIIAYELDVSSKEQLTSSFRYLFDRSVKEVFADFVEVESITFMLSAMAIIQSLASWVLQLQHLRVSVMMVPKICQVLGQVAVLSYGRKRHSLYSIIVQHIV